MFHKQVQQSRYRCFPPSSAFEDFFPFLYFLVVTKHMLCAVLQARAQLQQRSRSTRRENVQWHTGSRVKLSPYAPASNNIVLLVLHVSDLLLCLRPWMGRADCRAVIEVAVKNFNAAVFGTCSKDVRQWVDMETKCSAGNLSRMGSRHVCDSINKLPLHLWSSLSLYLSLGKKKKLNFLITFTKNQFKNSCTVSI